MWRTSDYRVSVAPGAAACGETCVAPGADPVGNGPGPNCLSSSSSFAFIPVPSEICGIDERTPESDPRRAEHRRLRGVAIASSAGAGFLEVPDGSTVAVGRSLEITVASI